MRFALGHAIAVAPLLLLLSPSSVHATVVELGGTVGCDGNLGADQLLLLGFTDGETQEIKGGNGCSIGLGAGAIFFEEQPHRLQTVFSVNAKYSTMLASENASLDFVRIPLELLAFYRNDAFFFRVGGGAAYYAYTSMAGSGDLILDVTFKPTVAGILQADFIYGGFAVGLRYTALSITPEGSNQSFAAGSIGVLLGFFHRFGEVRRTND